MNNPSERTLKQAEFHEKIGKELKEMYIQKNTKYGNSFSRDCQEFGMISAIIQLSNKMRRAKHLVMTGNVNDEESLRDSLVDLANYSIMAIMEIDGEIASIDDE